MYIMHSWYLYLNILKENFIIYVPNRFNLQSIKGDFDMSSKDVSKLIKDKQVEFVDLRFTDPKGKLQHLTMDATIVDDEMLDKGVFFDGSSIAGWKAINESDMILKPDTSRFFLDPFTSHNTVVLFCDILDAVKKTPY